MIREGHDFSRAANPFNESALQRLRFILGWSYDCSEPLKRKELRRIRQTLLTPTSRPSALA